MMQNIAIQIVCIVMFIVIPAFGSVWPMFVSWVIAGFIGCVAAGVFAPDPSDRGEQVRTILFYWVMLGCILGLGVFIALGMFTLIDLML